MGVMHESGVLLTTMLLLRFTGYYHEFMLKDRPHLCQYMPPCKDARRLVADPANEPNFYHISRQYPLDGSVPVRDATEDLPQAKRLRVDSVTMPQSLAFGTNGLPGAPVEMVPNQPGLATFGAPSPAMLGVMPQHQQLNAGAAPVSNQAAALLKILEAQNQKRKEEEQQCAMLAAAILQQQQQGMAQEVPSTGNNNNTLAAVLGMLGQH